MTHRQTENTQTDRRQTDIRQTTHRRQTDRQIGNTQATNKQMTNSHNFKNYLFELRGVFTNGYLMKKILETGVWFHDIIFFRKRSPEKEIGIEMLCSSLSLKRRQACGK